MQWKIDYISVVTKQTLLYRSLCIDALSYAGTAEAVRVLEEMFDKQNLTKPDEFKRVFLGLASASRPTADHINIVWVSDK